MTELKGQIVERQVLSGNIERTTSLNGSIKSGSTASDYERLKNLPSIESVTLRGNKSLDELGLTELSNADILNILGGKV